MESEVFQEQMSACLNCRACEAVCPSGVQYGQILEASRTQIEQARDGWPAAAAPVAGQADARRRVRADVQAAGSCSGCSRA